MDDIQRTLVVIKPDGLMMGNVSKIKEEYSKLGLKEVKEKIVHLSYDMACELYLEHSKKFFFVGVVLAMSCGPCVALIYEGENAINQVRLKNGATDPAQAEVGTIRQKFRSAGGPFNTVHASDCEDAFKREVKIFFDDENI